MAPLFTVMFDVPNVLVSTPDVASAYVILIVVVLVPPVATLIVGAAVVTVAVGGYRIHHERGEARIRGDRRCPPDP